MRCYFNCSSMNKLPTAPKPMTAAAIASPTSNPLTRFTAGGAGGRAGAAEAGAALGAPLGGPATRAPGAPADGAGGAGRGGGAPGACGAALPGGAPAGAALGNVGNLIVAVGLGGKLIRTVSFFPGGFGGTDPPGGGVGFGTLSAINCCDFK